MIYKDLKNFLERCSDSELEQEVIIYNKHYSNSSGDGEYFPAELSIVSKSIENKYNDVIDKGHILLEPASSCLLILPTLSLTGEDNES